MNELVTVIAVLITLVVVTGPCRWRRQRRLIEMLRGENRLLQAYRSAWLREHDPDRGSPASP